MWSFVLFGVWILAGWGMVARAAYLLAGSDGRHGPGD